MNQLQEYIKNSKEAGLEDSEIINNLKEAGWEESQINEAFTAVQGSVSVDNKIDVSHSIDIDKGISQSDKSELVQPIKKMGKFKISWLLMGSAWGLLKKDKNILWIPVVSFLVSSVFNLILVLLFFSDIFSVRDYESFMAMLEHVPDNLFRLVVVLMYLISVLITVFFNASIMSIVYARLKGQAYTISEGFAYASKYIVQLFLWVLYNFTIGQIINFIAEKIGFIRGLILRIVGKALWGIFTYFTVPFILFGNKNAFKAVNESAKLMNQKWGESLITNFSFSLIFGIIVFFEIIGFGIGAMSLISNNADFIYIIILSIVFIISIFIIILISSVLNTVLKVVLYEYSISGQAPEGFDKSALAQAIVPKK